MKREETVTIRVSVKSKVGLDLLVAEHHLKTGKNMTLSDAIWYLLQKDKPEIIERIEKMSAEGNEEG
jgi:hypothetical protein